MIKKKTDNGLKPPAAIYFPYVEKFGLLLLIFLNADLSSYETAYKGNLYTYAKNDNIIRDSYSNKNHELTEMSEKNY